MNATVVLNSLGQRINRWYPNINYGGCCVYAAILGSELEKRNIPVRVIVAAYAARNGTDIAKIANNIADRSKKQTWNENGVFFNHVGLEIKIGKKWHYYDSDGCEKRGSEFRNFPVYRGRISVEDAKKLASDTDGWNPDFDRAKIPSIKRHVKKFLATNLPV